MPKVVIDPVTRIEGHLRITAVVEGGKVTEAWNTAEEFRGFEIFMKGRHPRDAWHFAQRICGVCPNPHAWNGAKAAETAMGIEKVPDGARIVRNMMEAAQIGYDHILHFYILQAFDYVNVPNSLNAKPTIPSLKLVQDRVRAVVESGQLGPFANHWWDHPAYKLPPDLDLELTAHYLMGIEVQQKACDAMAKMGGKYPMIMNYAAGGVTKKPTEEEVLYWRGRMMEVKDFIDTVMVQDLLAIAPFYIDHAAFGQGVKNYLTWGNLDDKTQDPYNRLFPAGAIFDADLSAVQKADPDDTHMFTKHSYWPDAKGAGKHPLDTGQDDFKFTGYPSIDGPDLPAAKYDWTQAPRFGDQNRVMEVGPLAQMLVAYVSGRQDAKTLVDTTLQAIGQAGKPEVLISALGRVAARVLKAKMNADNALRWSDELLELLGKPSGGNDFFDSRALDVPASGRGKGGWDGPRGALCHYMQIENGKIGKYAAVPASNWNLSPRDDDDNRGPVEEALVGTPVADPNRPLEILRVVHGFDP